MNELKLKYLVQHNAYGSFSVYVCTDDHRCSLRGCKINLDVSDSVHISIPFNDNNKYKNIHGKYCYCIGYNWKENVFKCYDYYTDDIGNANYKFKSTELKKQIDIADSY